MSKVTSKRQVTIPKAVADRYGINPGDRIRWIPAGDEIRVVPARGFGPGRLTTAQRVELFDRATVRRDRPAEDAGPEPGFHDRGWTRADLYDRGRTG